MPPIKKKTGGTCFLYYYFSVYVNLFKELMPRHKKTEVLRRKRMQRYIKKQFPPNILKGIFIKRYKFFVF